MGAGVAGLRAAVELARYGEVLIATKESLGESNTWYAQGGIAVAMEGDRDVALHLEDTVAAGDGLVYRPAAQALVAQGPVRVAELIEWGARFDQEDGRLLRTREGAHSLARILHASGDATGSEISRALLAFARTHRQIRFAEWTRVTSLVLDGRRVIGADLVSDNDSSSQRVSTRAVLIASGGAGQVYSDTTNPAVATGDGIALAAQVGAELADMEFYQFHPTALQLPGAPRFLVSEALRGEGAYLRNQSGQRFMLDVHPLAELAPRDVVARAIAREFLREYPSADAPQQDLRPRGGVYLDMRHVRGVDLHKRFPGISATLAQYQLDLARDLIPVGPAAHYLMGGIRTDLAARTSVGGLYAAGEAACTGVHGANRLASNSLLEGLVFGARAAQSMLADGLPIVASEPANPAPPPLTPDEESRVASLISTLQSAMWTHSGLLRDASRLRDGLAVEATCETRIEQIADTGRSSRRLEEAQSLCRVARAILRSAIAREESRGAHFRNDFPNRDDARFEKHSLLSGNNQVRFETW
jgi:L-aspartate oxidase